MLSSNDLLTCDRFVGLDEISLELYRVFSENILLQRRFHYYFNDGTDIIVEFKEFAIRHLLGIQHIDSRIEKNQLFQRIKEGLKLGDFEADAQVKRRYKNCKPRI